MVYITLWYGHIGSVIFKAHCLSVFINFHWKIPEFLFKNRPIFRLYFTFQCAKTFHIAKSYETEAQRDVRYVARCKPMMCIKYKAWTTCSVAISRPRGWNLPRLSPVIHSIPVMEDSKSQSEATKSSCRKSPGVNCFGSHINHMYVMCHWKYSDWKNGNKETAFSWRSALTRHGVGSVAYNSLNICATACAARAPALHSSCA